VNEEKRIQEQIQKQAQGGMVDMERATMFGTGPLENTEIQARIAEAQRSKRYMIAVWSLSNGEINYSAVTNMFPTEDIKPSLNQFEDSCSDFIGNAIKFSEDIIEPAEDTPTQHDSGVTTVRREHDDER